MLRQALIGKVMSVVLLVTGLGWIGERSGQRFQAKFQAEFQAELQAKQSKIGSEMGVVAASAQLRQAALFLPSPPQPSLKGRVIAVSTGDALTVQVGQQQMRLRLCGIDAPELNQPWGKAAQAALQKLLAQTGGVVQFMPVRHQSQWVIAAVFGVGPSPQLVNQKMVEDGFAYVYQPYVQECPYQQAIQQAETRAQNRRHGLWAKRPLQPWEYRRQQVAQHIAEQLAQQLDPVKALGRFSPDYLRDGMQRTHLGLASWYGPTLNGSLTANGETFDQTALTAAHSSLPFNIHLKVTNLHNGRSVIVRINDHHPALYDSTLDLSQAAAEQLDSIEAGVVPVEWVILSSGR